MFKVGDRVRIKSLGDFDAQAGVTVGMVGTVKNILGCFVIPGDAAYVVFDEHLIGGGAGNTRWIGVACLELVPSAPKRKGFKVGDRVVVVRGNKDQDEVHDLEEVGLLGRFGVIADLGDQDFKYVLKFEGWDRGWHGNCDECDSFWGFDTTTNLRFVQTVQNVNG